MEIKFGIRFYINVFFVLLWLVWGIVDIAIGFPIAGIAMFFFSFTAGYFAYVSYAIRKLSNRANSNANEP